MLWVVRIKLVKNSLSIPKLKLKINVH